MNTKVYKKEISSLTVELLIETGKLQNRLMVLLSYKWVVPCFLQLFSARNASPVDFTINCCYGEKFAAAGKFPGGFFKREARPSNEEILAMRLVDRVLRPLFPKDYHHETQVMIQLMSHDENVMPDSLAGLAASTVIQLSDIPFNPISEVRVGRINGDFSQSK